MCAAPGPDQSTLHGALCKGQGQPKGALRMPSWNHSGKTLLWKNDPQTAEDALKGMLILKIPVASLPIQPLLHFSFPFLFFSPSLFSSFLSFILFYFFSEITFTTSIGGCYILWSLQINLCARNFSQHFYVTLLYLTELNETEKGNISHLLEFYSLLLLIEICKLIYTNINCIILSFQKSIREVNWWFSSL